MRSRHLAGWVVAAVLAASFQASAEDGAAKKWYDLRAVKVARAAAQRLWEAADRARKESLFRFAREEASRALEFDPDHRLARAFLGYVKKEDGWQIDPELHAKLPSENQIAPAAQQRLAEVEDAWRRVIAAKADLDVAASYAAFGDECAVRAFPAEARAAYTKSLSLDPDSAVAHHGLGHVKFAEGIWITAEAQRAYELSRIVTTVDASSRWEEIVGAPMAKAESAHFHFESALGREAVERYLVAAERAYAAWFGDLGLDSQSSPLPVKPQPVFCVMSDDAQWNRWIDKVAVANPGFWRTLTLHWAADRWAVALRSPEGVTEAQHIDRIVHQTVHLLDSATFALPRGHWLDEALAYRCAVILGGTTSHFCVSPRKSEYAQLEDDRVFLDQTRWTQLLKESVTRKDDIALRAVVAKSAFDLPVNASVKAWSVLDYLLHRDRAAVVGMLRDAKDTKDQVGNLETHFGKAVETVDDEWRKWVLATY